MTIQTKLDGMKADLKIKRADYISKNIDILQEFGFSHPKTKILINSIYNSHFSGSSLWDLFSKEAIQLENTWNVSMRLMLDLPRGTHRRMIEPLSRVQHIKFALVKRFLSFIEQIRTSTKNSSKFLLESILLDTNSVTGSNLRNILLMTDKTSIHQLVPNDATIMKYHQMNEPELWKISIIEEMIEMKNGNMQRIEFDNDEMEELLEYLCVS